jgi:structure-specific recognition protein 1
MNRTTDRLFRETLKEKYEGRLQAQYENSYHAVVSNVFRGLSGRKILTPTSTYHNHHGQEGVKCSIKASEGFLYMFDKAFMFVPKPATYIAFENVISITMSRVGGAVSASRTFDIAVAIKGGVPDYNFSNINREEQTGLEDFFRSKNLRTKNEMLDDVSFSSSPIMFVFIS